jgi:hypothetical protein
MRLAVESEIRLLNGRVVDAVARRMSHVIRASAHAQAKKWKEVDAELAAFRELPGLAEFERQLNAIRIPALEAADKAKNRMARRAIEKLCNDASAIINRHLAPKALQQRIDDIEALRAAG